MHPAHSPSAATQGLVDMETRFGARNYNPLPLAASRALGCWIWDVDGKKLLDMMSAYSAVSLGHARPELLEALTRQAARLAVTSRAYHNDQLPLFLRDLAAFTGFPKALPMNSGAEAVETAIKACRKWGEKIKGIPAGGSKIVVCENNFHGRTTTIVGFSSDDQYRDGFGPFAGGFLKVPFGDLRALTAAFEDPEVCAFVFEPVQGEAGIVLPPAGYLAAASRLARTHRVLFVADEIQTGFARTGVPFAHKIEADGADGMILGKALGGGLLPISAFCATEELMGVFNPGDHGSTFGGNPLACAVARAALPLLMDPALSRNSMELGDALVRKLGEALAGCPFLVDVRGRGLFAAVEVSADVGARELVERMIEHGVISKETHGTVVRLAPPLTISIDEIDFAAERVARAFDDASAARSLAWRSGSWARG